MVMTSTDTAAVGLQLLSAYVQQRLVEQAVLIPTIMDFTGELRPGAKTVDISRHNTLAAEELVEGNEYTPQTLTWVADELVLNTQEGVYVELTTKGGLQAAIAQEPKLFEAATDALVQKLEQRVYNTIKASSSSPDHTIRFSTVSTLTVSDIIEARRLLANAKVPSMDVYLGIHPDQEADLLREDQFLDASKYGSNMPLLNGEIGRILGFRVLRTTNIPTGNAVFWHRTTSAFARQLAVTWERQRALKGSKTEYLLETLFGLKTLDGGVRSVYMNDTN